MKIIATAAAILILATSAWADEPANMQQNEPAAAHAPIVLSESEMDGVTAGGGRAIVREPANFLFDEPLSNLDVKIRPLKSLKDQV